MDEGFFTISQGCRFIRFLRLRKSKNLKKEGGKRNHEHKKIATLSGHFRRPTDSPSQGEFSR